MVNKLSFTDGPWEAVELNKGEALIVQPCDTSKQPICLVDRVPNAWNNAYLLAAAREMYKALDFAHSAMLAALISGDADSPNMQKAREVIRVALAKAEAH
jgi:hypothetical protein